MMNEADRQWHEENWRAIQGHLDRIGELLSRKWYEPWLAWSFTLGMVALCWFVASMIGWFMASRVGSASGPELGIVGLFATGVFVAPLFCWIEP